MTGTAAAEPAEPEVVSLACDLCDERIERHASGKRSAANMAALHLGLHKRQAHGISGRTAKRREAEDLAGEHGTVRQVAAGLTDAVSEVRKSRAAPKTDELAGVFGRLATLASTLGASLLVESDPSIPAGPAGEQLRAQTLDALILDPARARKIMHPIARSLEPTRLNKRYGRKAVDNADVLNSVAELGLYAWTVRAYLVQRRAALDRLAAADVAGYGPYGHAGPGPTAADAFGPLPTEPVPSGNGAGPPGWTAPAGWTGTPPPSRGVVITPDMLNRPA